MKVSPLLKLLLLLGACASDPLAALVPRGPGETLTVQCQYPSQFKNHGKVWCRIVSVNQCTTIVKTTQNQTSGRTRIQDNKEIRVISITFENLTSGDNGEYWCGVQVSNTVEILKRIELKVYNGWIADVILRGPGESLTVLCDYFELCDGLEKVWCKETNRGTCDPIVSTAQGDPTLLIAASARTTIQDNQQTRWISTTIEKLAEMDSGVYFCKVPEKDLHLKRFQLQVSEDVRAEVIAATSGDNVTVQCTYPTGHESSSKTWCRETIINNCNPIVRTTSSFPERASSGRDTILDNNQTRVISVHIGKLTEEDAGFYWCGLYLSDRVRISRRFELQVSTGFRTLNVPAVAGNCTTTDASSLVCKSDWTVITLVTVIILNKVLAAGGIYVIIRRRKKNTP